MRFRIVSAFTLAIAATVVAGTMNAHAEISDSSQKPYYSVANGNIIRNNGDRYHNRPLYCKHMPVVVLAGDRPAIRMTSTHFTLGHFMLAVKRANKAEWVHDFSARTMSYKVGRVSYDLEDVDFDDLKLKLEIVTLAKDPGYVAKLIVEKSKPGDELIWVYGGCTQGYDSGNWMDDAEQHYAGVLMWKLDPNTYQNLITRGFMSQDCTDNLVKVDGPLAQIILPAYTRRERDHPSGIMAIKCMTQCDVRISDASVYENPLALLTEKAGKQPLICGKLNLKMSEKEIFWTIENFEGTEIGDGVNLNNPKQAYKAGIERALDLSKQVYVDTPDEYFDTAVNVSAASIDGVYYPPVYVHGGMAWNQPYPGWRTIFGAIAYGWHENVKAEAKYYISSQVKTDEKTKPFPDLGSYMARQSNESMYCGKGKILQDAFGYNFQTQFFDQIVHEWRYTADPELEALLRPALELHVDWQKRCFDPDGDGCYESYINTWPTDSVWYNGGGSIEESVYAYYGRIALMEMATKAGDTAKAKEHKNEAENIKHGLATKLWNREMGHPGTYIEQYGHQRRRDDPWLYNVFLPIDAGIWSLEESLQALHYTEWGLQRVKGKFGGEKCWTSNWVPSLWSVREMHLGDCWHLALAYYQCGLPKQGWELIRGGMMETVYDTIVPGALSADSGTDFNDLSSMFCRVVIEGVYGYRPDYPNGVVTLVPQFPVEWDHASISTPDFSLNYKQQSTTKYLYELKLSKEAKVDFQAPVNALEVVSVKLNGQKASCKLLPGFGRNIIQVSIPATTSAILEFTTTDPQTQPADVLLAGNSGDSITLTASLGKITDISDPQGVIADAKVKDGCITGRLTNNAGNHLIIADTNCNGTMRKQLFKINVRDIEAETKAKTQLVEQIPANAKWATINISDFFNGDIREIFKQKYLSPRPDTCSLRIATDGYRAWNHPAALPEIDLEKVPSLVDTSGVLRTSQGVPFVPPVEGKNIAFTSLWDNWPDMITLPINKKADAVWLLVCGSTTAMHTRIANAEIRFEYEDGQIEKLELIPPINFWSLQPWGGVDYNYDRDAFCLPKTPPATVQLGNNCRAIVLNRRLREGVELKSVTLETLSPEVVIGLMGVTLMD